MTEIISVSDKLVHFLHRAGWSSSVTAFVGKDGLMTTINVISKPRPTTGTECA
jgi:hypothetical protein